METATITEDKNGLSAIIDRVKAGESVVVTDRGVPVAVIEPMSAHVEVDDRLARLERAGIIKRGRGKVPLELLRTIHSFDPCLACAVHVVDATGKERVRVEVR